MKKIVSVGKSRHRYIDCIFCGVNSDEKEILEIRFTRIDGNGNILNACKDCLDVVRKEIQQDEDN
ncbi:MAG: hypothetical protein ACRDCE_04660 [Cetobacterium sp.]|uniref:hypothetical protein n=1 Tax=Cetobacterium sp. TaxID=2071632 RepID=UPI003EE4EFE5